MCESSAGLRLNLEGFQRPGFLQQGGEFPIQGDIYFREAFNVLPAAIDVTNEDGLIAYYNETAAALSDRRSEPCTSDWRRSRKLDWPDGRPMRHDESPTATALKESRAIPGMEAIAERPNGQPRAIHFPPDAAL